MTIAARERRYVPQQAADLRLSLYRGYLPADPAWVLAERRVSLGPWVLHAQIVGASHVVAVSGDGFAVTEAIVAHSVHAAPVKPERSVPLTEPAVARLEGTDWAYAVTTARRAVAAGETEGWEARLLEPGRHRLSAAYPSGPEGRRGVTLLKWGAVGRSLRLESFHLYPDEAVVVTTVTWCEMDR
ncbi:MAG: DUF2617 family protein [Armatimonadetes bacterium]|nr:DUF2617 family protein [Armatimonadota bacterium]